MYGTYSKAGVTPLVGEFRHTEIDQSGLHLHEYCAVLMDRRDYKPCDRANIVVQWRADASDAPRGTVIIREIEAGRTK